MVLGHSEDEVFGKLRQEYGVSGSELVGDLRRVSTTQLDKPLVVFDNPYLESDYAINIVFPEFTSLCPKTGQPDFATIELEYLPDKVCVEMKALKLYLNAYRNEGHFYEEVTNLIVADLVKALRPRDLAVEITFNTRGGMEVVVTAGYTKEEDLHKEKTNG